MTRPARSDRRRQRVRRRAAQRAAAPPRRPAGVRAKARAKPAPASPEKKLSRLERKLRREQARLARLERRMALLKGRQELAKAIDTKRRHRLELSARADKHWKELGEPERQKYLLAVRHALEAEGFRSTLFQWRHRGHAYGLIKDLGDKQIHVRVYDNGIIDAEIEIHKRYLEHILSPRPSAHAEVLDVLTKHGLASHLVNEHYLPQVGADRSKYPGTRIKVSHVLSGVAAVGGMVAVSVARIALDRKKRKGL